MTTIAGEPVRVFTEHAFDCPAALSLFFPERGVVIHNLVTRTFPNMVSIAGGGFRDPLPWLTGIDELRQCQPSASLGCHGRPVVGAEETTAVLQNFRDALQFVHDQTVRGANHGLTPGEILADLRLPTHLAGDPALTATYADWAWGVPAMWQGYLGWYNGHAEQLALLPPQVEAQKIVGAFGGADAAVAAAQADAEQGDLAWAGRLLRHVLTLEPEHAAAREALASVLRDAGHRQPSWTGRNARLVQAAELRGDMDRRDRRYRIGAAMADELTAQALVEVLRYRIDPLRAAPANLVVEITLDDVPVACHLRQGVLEVSAAVTASPQLRLSTTRQRWVAWLDGGISRAELIAEAECTPGPEHPDWTVWWWAFDATAERAESEGGVGGSMLSSAGMASHQPALPALAERQALPPDGGPEWNRLIHSSSPYLLQHATIRWIGMNGARTLRSPAQRLKNKPIFLSIGYSTCHWCHVMADESFADDAVAEALNRDFIAVKLDREERPDVDQVYMAFVQATAGNGGWPLSVWLTPEREPIVGGTYFPRHGFLQALERITGLWQGDSTAMRERSARIIGEMERITALPTRSGTLPGPELIDTALADWQRQFDATDGGFGTAPKFPRPAIFEFLVTLIDHRHAAADQAANMLQQTLREMMRGGMYDQLGGGFHRYSVDGQWHVPHFEKLLYDQGQLLVSYVDAWRLTAADDPQRKALRAVIAATVGYLKRDLRHADGGLFSAEDADSQRPDGSSGEGAFYVWTEAEIETALSADDAAIAVTAWGVSPEGNVTAAADPHHEFAGVNILSRRLGRDVDPAVLASVAEQLLALRAERPRPHRDDKIVAAWNGLAISGLARVAECCGDTDALPLRAGQRASCSSIWWMPIWGGLPFVA